MKSMLYAQSNETIRLLARGDALEILSRETSGKYFSFMCNLLVLIGELQTT
jgi:hypothetical protein